MDLSNFLSLRISSFVSFRYVQVTLGIALEFFGHFHHRFSRDSVLIESTKTTIAVRRSVWTCPTFCHCGYRRSTLLDTFKSLAALLWSFSGTFTRILARFRPYMVYCNHDRSAPLCFHLSSFLSQWISSFGSSRYSQVSLGIPLEFFGLFHRRFSRDSVLISSTKVKIAVRRSVWTCRAFCHCGYRRSAVLDTFKSLSALLRSFSSTFTADSHEIPPL